MNAQEREAQKMRQIVEAQAMGNANNANNNDLREEHDDDEEEEVARQHCQPFPRGRGKQPVNFAWEDDDTYINGVGATGL